MFESEPKLSEFSIKKDEFVSKNKIFPRYRNGNPIWKYFSYNKKYNWATCLTCGFIIIRASKNTTNTRSHLKYKHKDLYDELLESCQYQRKMYDSNNWRLLTYKPMEEFIKEIIEKTPLEPEPDEYDDDDYSNFDGPSSPHQEPKADDTNLCPEEVALRLELLRAQIRKETAMAEFYESQNSIVKEIRK